MKFPRPRKLLCLIGIHQWKTFETCTSFTTTYSDKPHWGETKHFVWYDQCSCCGKRRMRDTVKKDTAFGDRHNGVEWARVQWESKGWAYIGSSTMKHFGGTLHAMQKGDVKPFAVIDGGKK